MELLSLDFVKTMSTWKDYSCRVQHKGRNPLTGTYKDIICWSTLNNCSITSCLTQCNSRFAISIFSKTDGGPDGTSNDRIVTFSA